MPRRAMHLLECLGRRAAEASRASLMRKQFVHWVLQEIRVNRCKLRARGENTIEGYFALVWGRGISYQGGMGHRQRRTLDA